jgi:3-carboxy-cis,cis-muconate cycloisomerase
MAPLLASLVGDSDVAALFEPAAEIGALLRFEATLAAAQATCGVIADGVAERIALACEKLTLDETVLQGGLAQDGVVIPALLRELRKTTGDASDKVHLGATSQDVIDSGFILRMRAVLTLLDERIALVLDEIERHEGQAGAYPLMAQTRMQAALPFTVASKLGTWKRPLESHRERIAAFSSTLPIQLGGPVGDGTSFGPKYELIRAETARRLDLRDTSPWHSDRSIILDIGQVLALLAGTLGKLGQDVALMAQSGVRAVELTSGGGSSAMTHKTNPVGAEILVALGRFAAGLMGTLSQAMIHENERSGAAWTLEWLVLPQLAEATGAATSHAAALLAQMRFGTHDG